MPKSAGRPPRSQTDLQEFRAKVSHHAMALYRADGFAALSMRRLSKEVGCAPTTLYAHFAGKTEILMLLWADILGEMVRDIQDSLAGQTDPIQRLETAALAFARYWTGHPEHFRLVFMSGDVGGTDVDSFMKTGDVRASFQMFTDLVGAVRPEGGDVKAKTDTLVAGLIGVALCAITIRNYPWVGVSQMTSQLVGGVTR